MFCTWDICRTLAMYKVRCQARRVEGAVQGSKSARWARQPYLFVRTELIDFQLSVGQSRTPFCSAHWYVVFELLHYNKLTMASA